MIKKENDFVNKNQQMNKNKRSVGLICHRYAPQNLQMQDDPTSTRRFQPKGNLLYNKALQIWYDPMGDLPRVSHGPSCDSPTINHYVRTMQAGAGRKQNI